MFKSLYILALSVEACSGQCPGRYVWYLNSTDQQSWVNWVLLGASAVRWKRSGRRELLAATRRVAKAPLAPVEVVNGWPNSRNTVTVRFGAQGLGFRVWGLGCRV